MAKTVSACLAAALVWARLLEANALTTCQPVLFVGTLGVEGAGDLRGVRRPFPRANMPGGSEAFCRSITPMPGRIVNGCVASRLYRLVFKERRPIQRRFRDRQSDRPDGRGAGGIHAIVVPTAPKTTYAAAVVAGGTSAHAIPDRVTLDVDMRSGDPAALGQLEAAVLRCRRQCGAFDGCGSDLWGTAADRRPARRRKSARSLAGAQCAARAGANAEPR